MKIIWIDPSQNEIKWSEEYILKDLFKVEKKDVLWLNENFDENIKIDFDNFFIVYSSDDRSLRSNTLNFIQKLYKENKKFNLLHTSNEQLRHDTSYYKLAKKVFRCYLDFNQSENNNITTIPIGYQSGYKFEGEAVLHKDKKYKCSFIGQPKNERFEMIETIKTIENSFIHQTKQWECPTKILQEDSRKIMSDSLVVPIPMGNIHFETHRFYEALEAKTIPVVRRYNNYDYYYNILGNHPVPFINNWNELPNLISYLDNKFVYDELCKKITIWYSSIKNHFSQKILQSYN